MENEAERAVAWTWHEILSACAAVLDYKLFNLDGSPVSVAKLLTGIFLLAAGFLLANRASTEFDRRVLGRLSIEDSLRYTFRRLFFYFTLFLVTVFTLRILHVPITIFTVMGGALAVGVGFGSQNLVNNFISGVLVMVERPIRVGDFIEVDGISGVVEAIGIRSTSVRALTNAWIVIPNTKMIENNLTNWSLASVVMGKLSLGVAYGTDVEKVSSLVLQALTEDSDVLAQPTPSVLFTDFGDNALILEVIYWTSAANVIRRKAIESQIRIRLNRLFIDQKVAIPFPQRDVHLDVTQPLPVKVLN